METLFGVNHVGDEIIIHDMSKFVKLLVWLGDCKGIITFIIFWNFGIVEVCMRTLPAWQKIINIKFD